MMLAPCVLSELNTSNAPSSESLVKPGARVRVSGVHIGTVPNDFIGHD